MLPARLKAFDEAAPVGRFSLSGTAVVLGGKMQTNPFLAASFRDECHLLLAVKWFILIIIIIIN